MALATIALIGFQGYWIHEARTVAEERFDQNVQEALQNVANKLQREEVLWLASQKMRDTSLLAQANTIPETIKTPASPESPPAVAQTRPPKTAAGKKPLVRSAQPVVTDDSSIALYPNVIQFRFQQSYTEYGPLYDADTGMVYPGGVQQTSLFRRHDPFRDRSEAIREWQEMQRQNEAIERWLNEAMYEQMRMMGIVFDTSANLYDSLSIQSLAATKGQQTKSPAQKTKRRKNKIKPDGASPRTGNSMVAQAKTPPAELQTQVAKVQQQSEMVKNVFHQLFSLERPVEQRIDPMTLDSMLRAEIRNQNIDIPFEYGVHSGKAGRIFFASDGPTERNIPAGAFTINLFTNDLHTKNDLLYVFFPDKQQFINTSTFWVMFASVLLSGVIMGLFYVSVSTIVKQKKLSEVKNDFINNMTHEFKTPISTISLACEMLQDPDVQTHSGQLNRYLRVIADENRRLGSQVEKVLQAAVLDKGKIKLKLTSVDLHEVIDAVLQNIGVQIEKRNGTIDLQLDAENTTIEADEVHVTNLIYNLLDNANKYSAEAPQITIRTQNQTDGVRISIADKGIGMTKEALSKIFDKFYRVSTGNVHNVKGFGLGLSYVKTIVEAHHGRIQVDSQPNAGSTFDIFLPYRQEKG